MKLAITGKGGAGKTTVAVLLAKHLAVQGRRVILVDADPDANAAGMLGLEDCNGPEPISELRDLIADRTGARGTGGEFFILNPKVDDIPGRYALDVEGIKLLRMGRMTRGGSGCFCPESAFLKSLLAHLLFADDDVVILDMEAGIEHLGRATARGVDVMIAVVTPGRQSLHTAFAIRRYAADIGLSCFGVLVNRYRNEEELRAVRGALEDLPLLALFPYDESIARSALKGTCPYVNSEDQRRRIGAALAGIQEFVERRRAPAESSG
jgi:CO dehydrogenase maturation factor